MHMDGTIKLSATRSFKRTGSLISAGQSDCRRFASFFSIPPVMPGLVVVGVVLVGLLKIAAKLEK